MPAKKGKKRPIAFADLMAVDRISAPAVAPGGARVAFVVTRPDHKENRTKRTIRLLDLRTREITDLTPGPSELPWSVECHPRPRTPSPRCR